MSVSITVVWGVFEFQDCFIFLSRILSFSGVVLNTFVNACVMLKLFTLKSSMYAVSVHVM